MLKRIGNLEGALSPIVRIAIKAKRDIATRGNPKILVQCSLTERNQMIFSKGDQTMVSFWRFCQETKQNFSLMFSSCNPFLSQRSAAKRTQV